ncbi:hypothetical protein ILUMI_06555 [Ignelater luminosus]|uniref:Uncharacterized protein n=1 Tax=Ignelater luminosus TaxID=2038154 RepID=A0A8K0D5I7_IGNLU|nr:hypothetical protein ILUMI_06555 [Ignelater luminosus]
MPVVTFQSIEVELPPVNLNGLSTDQKYLYVTCLAIKSGSVSQRLAEKQPGKVSASRLTIAKRILRLYVVTENSPDSLETLANTFAHSENILVAMLGDDREHIRKLVLRRILKCRNSHPVENGFVPKEIGILKFPCHTQAAERHIRLVTEASFLVHGTTARD